MKVSPSLPPSPHKNCHCTLDDVERVLDDLVWSKVRFGGFWWLSYGIVLGLLGTVWHRLAWQHLTFFACV